MQGSENGFSSHSNRHLPLSQSAFSFNLMSNQHDAPQTFGSTTDLNASPDGDFAAALNARLDGWNAAMGVRLVRATVDEVTAEVEVGARHRQAYGIVHGGVYAGLVETASSVAAALWARRNNQSVVGLENHTSFLHAVREGKLSVTARPLMRGRRTQVWEATVTDGAGRTVAQGKVRLMSLEAGAALAGEQVKIKPSGDD
jgi:1,4-dihydroxy-2-naphthoyl-CoA hydrolase